LPLVVLAAHPDDETLGAGGLIHMAAAAGRDVHVVVATDGEASHPSSRTLQPEQLARIRRAEVAAAVGELAPGARLTFLGLPDGGLHALHDQLTERVTALLDRPVLLVAPWEHDAHPDHEACAVAARQSVRTGDTLWQYPIWAWHWDSPEHSRLLAAPLAGLELPAPARAAKRAALDCHVSQHRPLSPRPGDEAILQHGMLAHFTRDLEVFVPDVAAATRPGYFDELYAEKDDPWNLAGRFYETRKRGLLLASLPRPRFGAAFEPGCATGLLTAELARRCATVLAWDGAARAVELARARVGDRRDVRIERRRIPGEWPPGRFELIVLSEVGYYCPDLALLAGRIDAGLAADGVLVACHWRHAAPDHPRTAEQVHASVGAGLRRIASHVEEDFLLDVWTRGGESVARSTGVLA
jgi:LmbE family N-acetylglucosaminyl deacetylase/SAM-dependent methyltransferase